ncbi:MAG: ABC transporter permease [Thermoanaerobaculia bacterium]|nr:ABC transporter permease [Thermoanaerobaculia bacterium]
MFSNNLKLLLRSLRKNIRFTFINVFGLATGITCCLLIYDHVQRELSFDRHHRKAERIYRLNLGSLKQGTGNSAITSGAMAPAFAPDFPEIDEYVRFKPFPSLVENGAVQFYEDGFYYTDSIVFDVFDFRLKTGNPAQALAQPFSVVLTEKAARKYFGDQPAMGKRLEIDNQFSFLVTGILQDVPANSHFTFDFLASVSSLRRHPNESVRYWQLHSWYSHYYHTYLLLKPGTDPKALGAKIEKIAAKYSDAESYEMYGRGMGLYLQALTDIHLNPMFGEPGAQGNKQNLWILGIVGLIILLIACSNYANLAAALALQRDREIGVRKVLGAGGSRLLLPFFGESFFISGISLAVSMALLQAATVLWEQISGHRFEFRWEMIPAALFIFSLTGLLGGIYPSAIGRSFHPAMIFRQEARKIKGISFGKALLVFQFVLSLGLIVATLVVHRQLRFMQNQPLGMDMEQVVVLPTRGNPTVTQRFASFENELKKTPGIGSVTISELVPGQQIYGFVCRFEGMEQGRNFASNPVGYDFFKTYDIPIAAGRVFSRDIPTDTLERAVINEALARELGWKDPRDAIGKRFDFGNDGENIGEVIGVVKDAHFQSFRHDIQPLLFIMDDHFSQHISLRLSTRNVPETLEAIGQTWRRFFPDLPYEYFFADAHFGRQYAADRQLAILFACFVGLAILLACVGLFGLSAFAVQRRVKEIGIRKVLGATAAGITALLSKDFLKLVLLAAVIASPPAWYAMEKWLQGFAYRIDIQGWEFALAGIIALAAALLTVSVQSIQAALADPVRSLRSE